MNLPKSKFVLRKMADINDRFEIHCSRITSSDQFATEYPQFSLNEFAALFRSLFRKIPEPKIEVPGKAVSIPGRPPMKFLITRIGRSAIQQCDERHVFTT